MLNLSDQFGFESLKNAIGDQLTATVDLKNVLQLLSYADMYQVTKLVESCCAFVDRHAESVLCSDAIATINHHALTLILSRDSLCVPEMQVFQTVIRWKENNDGNDEALKEVLNCVRLTEIPPQALLSEIEASSLFERGGIMLALKAQLLPDFELMKPRGIKR